MFSIPCSRFIDFCGSLYDVMDFLIVGFCLASDDRVVGIPYLCDDDDSSNFGVIYYYYDSDTDIFYYAVCDGCDDTLETRKNAIFVRCDTLTRLYHSLPFYVCDMLNGEERCASIRSKHEFNIDTGSL